MTDPPNGYSGGLSPHQAVKGRLAGVSFLTEMEARLVAVLPPWGFDGLGAQSTEQHTVCSIEWQRQRSCTVIIPFGVARWTFTVSFPLFLPSHGGIRIRTALETLRILLLRLRCKKVADSSPDFHSRSYVEDWKLGLLFSFVFLGSDSFLLCPSSLLSCFLFLFPTRPGHHFRFFFAISLFLIKW